jgi:hypothetical protein
MMSLMMMMERVFCRVFPFSFSPPIASAMHIGKYYILYLKIVEC